MNRPLVSIITPCYNGECYLDRYFRSILNQTYPNLELIFINDGSTDRTEELARNYAPLLEARGVRYLYLHQKNAGQAAALNRGLKHFTGAYLTWPDADDEMTSDCIEKKVAYLEAHPELDMCICKILQVAEEDPPKPIGILERNVPDENDNLFDDLIFVENVFYAPGGYIVRSSAVDNAIPNREIYAGPGGQNAQLLLPISYRGKFGYIDEILYKYYIRTNSHSHSVNTSEKIITQLKNFEVILLETLAKMPGDVYQQYESRIRKHYARLRFGNALDTQHPHLITQYYRELSQTGAATAADWLHFIRHTVPVFQKLPSRKSGE